MGEQYTPGHSANATAFMAARSFSTHGEFIRPYLTPGMNVLDCGCGPGVISVGLAEAVGPNGHVTGIDFAESQVIRSVRTVIATESRSGRLASVR